MNGRIRLYSVLQGTFARFFLLYVPHAVFVIPLLLQRENYHNDNGEARYQINFYAAFEAQTEFMAAEIWEKATKPVALEKVLNRLINTGDAHRKPKNNQISNSYQQSAGTYQNPGATSQPPKGHPADLDDDLPF